jgi:hypothetical protein
MQTLSADSTTSGSAACESATSRIAEIAAQLLAEAGCKHGAVRQAAEKLLLLLGPADATSAERLLSQASSQACAELVTLCAQSEASPLIVCGLHVLLAALPELRVEAGEVSRTISFSLSLVATHAKGRLDVAVLCAFTCCCCASLLPLDAVDACLLLNALLRMLATTPPNCARTAMDAAVRAFVTVLAGGPVSAEELASVLMFGLSTQASGGGPLRRLIAKYTPLLRHPRLEQCAPEVHVAVFLELAHISMDADQDAMAPCALECMLLLLRHLPADASIYTHRECEARFSCCVDDLDTEQSCAVLVTLLKHRHLRRWARRHIAACAAEVFDGHAPQQLLHACTRLHQEVSSDTPPQPLMHFLFSFADDDDRAGAVITTLASSLHRMADDVHLSKECAVELFHLCSSLSAFLDETLAHAALHLRVLQLARIIPAAWPRLHAAMGTVQQRGGADDSTVAIHCARALRSLLHVCGAVFSDVASDVACGAQMVLASTLASQLRLEFPRELVLEATHAGRFLQPHCWTFVWSSVLTLRASGDGATVDDLLASLPHMPADTFVAALSAMAAAASAALDAQSPDAWLLERFVKVVVHTSASDANQLGVAWRLVGNAFLAPFAADKPRPATQLVAAAAYSCAVESLLQHSRSDVQLLQTPEARSKGVSLLSPALRIAELGTACDEVYELLARLCASLLCKCARQLSLSSWAAILDLCGHAATLRCGEPVLTAFYFALESAVTALQGADVLYDSEPRASLLAALFAWSRQPNTSRALDAIGLVVVLAPQLGGSPPAAGIDAMAPPPPPSTPARVTDTVGHTAALSGLASLALCRECGPVVRIEAVCGLFDCAIRCSATHAWTSGEWLHVLADYICVVLDGLIREHAESTIQGEGVFVLTASCLILERTCGLFEQLDWHVASPCLEGVVHVLCLAQADDWPAFSSHAASVLVRLARTIAAAECDASHWAVMLRTLATVATPRLEAFTAIATITSLSRYSPAVAHHPQYGAALLALVEAVITAMRSSRSVEVQCTALDVLVCALPIEAATQACVGACVALVEHPSSRDTEVARKALRVLEAAPLDADALAPLLLRKLSLIDSTSEVSCAGPDGA